MTRIRARLAIVALIFALPAAATGCGDDGAGSSEDPSQVLEETFNNFSQIDSGVLDLSLDGSAGSQGSLSVKLSGPFEGLSDISQVPQLDWTGSLSVKGAGQSFGLEGALTTTNDNAYITYQGQAYEVGARAFAQFERDALDSAQTQPQNGQSFTQACRQAVQQGGGDPSACDIDLTNWLTNVTNEGTESVDGTDSIHISGDANVKQIFSDLSGVAKQLPGASAQSISPSQLDQVESAITNATIDVYTGADDKLLRKLDFDLTIDLSSLGGGSVIPVSSVDVAFSLAFSDLNSNQSISAPENPKPISELRIGDLGPLGSVGSGGVGGPSPAYLDCVENNPSDPSVCASKL